MYLRLPQAAGDEQVIGAIVASVLLLPLISIIPAISRLFIPNFSKAGLWQPVVLGAMAIWTALWMLTINAYTMQQPAKLDFFLRWATGYYLGMLAIVPPLLVYERMRFGSPVVSNFLRDVGLAAVILLSLFLCVALAPKMENSLRIILLLGMITPAVALSRVHGWRGAAVGVAMTNVAIAQSIPNLSKLGDHDTAAFHAQLVLAFAATILLVIGELFSRHFETLRDLGIAEEKAKRIARLGINYTEKQIRDHVMILVQHQIYINEDRAALILNLRRQGNHAAANEVQRALAKQPELFEAQYNAFFPVSIESHGLYHALQSPSFPVIVAGGKEVRLWLRGQPKLLSTELQFSAYRIIGSAIAFLSDTDPTGYRIRARVWRAGMSRGISLSIRTIHGGKLEATSASSIAVIDLDNRVRTRNGAKWRRRGQRVIVLLPDMEQMETYRSDRTTDHASPSGV